MTGEVVGTGAETLVRLDNGGMAKSAIPTQVSDKGMKVKIGVRPEDFVETEGDAVFTGEVEITEALGEVTLLYFKRQGEAAQVVAKLPGIRPELRRQSVKLTADPKKVHLFANGKSLLYR
jgi:alpha-glucoside transport system ATP-binding protein